MSGDRLTEFVTVLAYALVISTVLMLSIFYLEGTVRVVALIALVTATIIAWQYLRRRFGRGR